MHDPERPLTLFRRYRPAVAALALAAPLLAHGKPIAYQDGSTFVLDYMPHEQEAQFFYAPDYRSSLGGGYLRVELPDPSTGHVHPGAASGKDSVDIGYLRFNVLAKRWNWTDSQANIYFWGGIGTADSGYRESPDTVPNAGLQVDAESRRFYGSLKSDWHSTFAFTHGMTVAQFGVAPYLHDYNTLATWIVLQGHAMSGNLHEEAGGALLVRLFWRGIWGEAGVTDDGELLSLLMFNL
jgi:hypothetical protein